MDTVSFTFTYEPEEPDPDDGTGMSAEEYERVTEALMALGAEDIRVERVRA
jgi:hypothetical protein